MKLLREMYAIAREDKRTDVPLSKLRIGLKCGGSDGLSGITANPMLGVFSDYLVAQGGTTVLTEVPEMFGAETLLMNRCRTQEIFDDTVTMINDFKNYFICNDQPIYEILRRETRREVFLHLRRNHWDVHRSREARWWRMF